jgi:NAD(P)-dependent dehydrogenase (short-subunit alcohol dehydrogenase family)
LYRPKTAFQQDLFTIYPEGGPLTDGKENTKNCYCDWSFVWHAQEIAGVAYFLAGPDSSYMTGSVITVEGGFTIIF